MKIINKNKFIYVLKLQHNKYYIGKTINPTIRINNHLYSKGAIWTSIYKPIEVLEIIPNCDDYDEDKYTRIYMDRFGINNVRGGSYSSIKLNKSTIQELVRLSNGTNDCCFLCGNSDHFAKNCRHNKFNIHIDD